MSLRHLDAATAAESTYETKTKKKYITHHISHRTYITGEETRKTAPETHN